MVEYWNSEKWLPVAVQTMVKRFMSIETPKVKHVKDVLRASDVFLMGGQRSHYYGEKATIVDDQGLATHGRVNSKCLTLKKKCCLIKFSKSIH